MQKLPSGKVHCRPETGTAHTEKMAVIEARRKSLRTFCKYGKIDKNTVKEAKKYLTYISGALWIVGLT